MANYSHTCEQCGKQLVVPERYLGRGLKCPQCGQGFRVAPGPVAPPEPPSSVPHPLEIPSQPFGDAPVAVPPPAVSEPPAEFTAEASVRFKVKHVDVLTAAKVTAALYGVLGLLIGVLAAFMILVVPIPVAARGLVAPGKGVVALLALVAVPGSYLVIGFVSGALLTALYNLAVHIVGAVEVELE